MKYTPDKRTAPTWDVGRAVHFHGRDEVWSKFQHLLEVAPLKAANDGGGMFLVQGPPGAGKSAILHEFGERASKDDFWTYIVLDIDSLHDPVHLAYMLGYDAYAPRSVISKGRETTSGMRSIAKVEHARRTDNASEYAGPGVLRMLEEHAGGKGLLLTVDEVQDMEDYLDIPVHKIALGRFFRAIRNGPVSVPLVLLMGGLGNSLEVLQRLGMSRLPWRSLHNLGRLDKKAERRVIRDWIVKTGRPHPVHPHILNRWIDTIAAETDGWPQHIHNFAPIAAQWLLDNDRTMPDEVPEEVMETGRLGKLEYYVHRTALLEQHHLYALTELVASLPRSTTAFARTTLLDAFRTATEKQDPEGNMMSPSQAVRVAFKRGLVAAVPKMGPPMLRVPIPSMQRWLLGAYGRRTAEIGR